MADYAKIQNLLKALQKKVDTKKSKSEQQTQNQTTEEQTPKFNTGELDSTQDWGGMVSLSNNESSEQQKNSSSSNAAAASASAAAAKSSTKQNLNNLLNKIKKGNTVISSAPTAPTAPVMPTMPTVPTIPTVPSEPISISSYIPTSNVNASTNQNLANLLNRLKDNPSIPTPTLPTTPTVPTTPTAPTRPTMPTKPTTPTVPTTPNTPTIPAEPTVEPEPTFPAEPVVPLTPEEIRELNLIEFEKSVLPNLVDINNPSLAADIKNSKYDDNNKIISFTFAGDIYSVEYDENGNISKVSSSYSNTDGLGQTLTFKTVDGETYLSDIETIIKFTPKGHNSLLEKIHVTYSGKDVESSKEVLYYVNGEWTPEYPYSSVEIPNIEYPSYILEQDYATDDGKVMFSETVNEDGTTNKVWTQTFNGNENKIISTKTYDSAGSVLGTVVEQLTTFEDSNSQYISAAFDANQICTQRNITKTETFGDGYLTISSITEENGIKSLNTEKILMPKTSSVNFETFEYEMTPADILLDSVDELMWIDFDCDISDEALKENELKWDKSPLCYITENGGCQNASYTSIEPQWVITEFKDFLHLGERSEYYNLFASVSIPQNYYFWSDNEGYTIDEKTGLIKQYQKNTYIYKFDYDINNQITEIKFQYENEDSYEKKLKIIRDKDGIITELRFSLLDNRDGITKDINMVAIVDNMGTITQLQCNDTYRDSSRTINQTYTLDNDFNWVQYYVEHKEGGNTTITSMVDNVIVQQTTTSSYSESRKYYVLNSSIFTKKGQQNAALYHITNKQSDVTYETDYTIDTTGQLYYEQNIIHSDGDVSTTTLTIPADETPSRCVFGGYLSYSIPSATWYLKNKANAKGAIYSVSAKGDLTYYYDGTIEYRLQYDSNGNIWNISYMTNSVTDYYVSYHSNGNISNYYDNKGQNINFNEYGEVTRKSKNGDSWYKSGRGNIKNFDAIQIEMPSKLKLELSDFYNSEAQSVATPEVKSTEVPMKKATAIYPEIFNQKPITTMTESEMTAEYTKIYNWLAENNIDGVTKDFAQNRIKTFTSQNKEIKQRALSKARYNLIKIDGSKGIKSVDTVDYSAGTFAQSYNWGDCWFLAAVNCLSKSEIKSLIKENGDSYTVTFPGDYVYGGKTFKGPHTVKVTKAEANSPTYTSAGGTVINLRAENGERKDTIALSSGDEDMQVLEIALIKLFGTEVIHGNSCARGLNLLRGSSLVQSKNIFVDFAQLKNYPTSFAIFSHNDSEILAKRAKVLDIYNNDNRATDALKNITFSADKKSITIGNIVLPLAHSYTLDYRNGKFILTNPHRSHESFEIDEIYLKLLTGGVAIENKLGLKMYADFSETLEKNKPWWHFASVEVLSL